MTRRWQALLRLAGRTALAVLISWAALSLVVWAPAPLTPDLTTRAGPEPPRAVPGQIVVDLVDDVEASQVEDLEERLGIDLESEGRHAALWGLYKADVAAGVVEPTLQSLRGDPLVEAAEPQYLYEIQFFPNDPLYRPYQWHMDQIKAHEAWDVARGKGVVVAVIDTGVAYKDWKGFHRLKDLSGTRFVPGWDFVNRRPEAVDDHCHGTHVAGTIAQTTNNGEGVTGVAYEATLMPLKVLSARGSGTVGDIAAAIRYAADHGADVINMSLGGGGYSRIMESACRYAKNKGVLIVCAAGNNGQERISFPAAYKSCVAVSAVRYDREKTFYSNWGKGIALAAPGGDMRVDQNGDGEPDGVLQNTIEVGQPSSDLYKFFMGTSMASPHVAGAAAVVMSLGVTNPDRVLGILQSTAVPAGKGRGDPRYGAGILDVGAAARKTRAAQNGGRALAALVLGAAALFLAGGPRRVLVQTGALLGLLGLLGLAAGSTGFAGLGMDPHSGELGYPALEVVGRLGTSLGVGGMLVLAPVLLMLVLVLVQGSRPVAWLASGMAVGAAAHLTHAGVSGWMDVPVVPGIAGWLDTSWLFMSALMLLLGAVLSLRVQAARQLAGGSR